jgi:hypothetical protein
MTRNAGKCSQPGQDDGYQLTGLMTVHGLALASSDASGVRCAVVLRRGEIVCS